MSGEVGGGGEVGAVAGLGGGSGEADGEVGFPDAGRADQEDVGGRLEVAAGAELGDQVRVDAGGGVVVEPVEGGGGGQAGEPEPAGEAAGFGGVDLEPQQLLQRRGQGEAVVGGGVEDGRELFGGGVKPQHGEVAAELLVDTRRRPGVDLGLGVDHGLIGCGGHVRVFLPVAARS
jgi:hypothetical protein